MRLARLLATSLLACAGGLQAQPAGEQDQACLLAQLRTASASTTVAQLRERCTPPAKPSLPAQPSAATTAPTLELLQRLSDRALATLPAPLPVAELMQRPKDELSVVDRRVKSEIAAAQEPFALLPHRPNYLLPISMHTRPGAPSPGSAPFAIPGDSRQRQEMVFQTSFKFPLTEPLFGARALPFFAYTGKAWWQVFDADRSRPFREYNHEPEFFVAITPSSLAWAGWQHRLTTLGFAHHSNGRSAPSSRSWNRAFTEVTFDRGQTAWASLKVWHRLSEAPKTSPTDQTGDDNPDITRYLGNGEIKFGHVSAGGNRLTLTLRQSLVRHGKGAAQLDWSKSIDREGHMRFLVQGFSGYGDSLIDYNQRVHRLGLGIMLNDWF